MGQDKNLNRCRLMCSTLLLFVTVFIFFVHLPILKDTQVAHALIDPFNLSESKPRRFSMDMFALARRPSEYHKQQRHSEGEGKENEAKSICGSNVPAESRCYYLLVNGIEFEEIEVSLAKRQQYSLEFKEINPMKKVPAIVDGRLKLFESHAILIYLACAFPGIADHWYPNDLSKRAKIHSVLDWHHSNLRIGAAKFVLNTTLAPLLGLPVNPRAAAEAEKILSLSLSKIESFWLKGSGRFLVGSNQPSIADLSLVCEIMQLEVLDETDRTRLLGPHNKVQQWIENTKNATRPHFDEVHKYLFKVKDNLQKQRSVVASSETASSAKTTWNSKM